MKLRRSIKSTSSLLALGVSSTILACSVLAVQTQPTNAIAYLGAGLRLYALQRYAEAADEFNLALQVDPGLLNARYHLAVSYFEEHKADLARQQFEKLLPTGYRSRWVTYYLGRLDLESGRLDAAIGRLESLESSQPIYDELYYVGSALLQRGKPEAAVIFLRRQVAFNPLDFRAHYLLGRAYLKLGESQAAEREFRQSQRLHAYYLRGKEELTACREQLLAGRDQSAWTRCGSVLQTRDIDKLVAVGTLFGEFHDYRHALEALQKASSLDPQSPEINYDLGYTYYQSGRYVQAFRYSQQALFKRPDFFEALEVYGMALHRVGRDRDARLALRLAHQLRPDDTTVTEALRQITSLPMR
jgi:tetratricopeptide (TPR) repeat protein